MSVPGINEVAVTEEGVSVLVPRVRSIQIAAVDEGRLLTVTDSELPAPIRFRLTVEAANHLSRLLADSVEPTHA